MHSEMRIVPIVQLQGPYPEQPPSTLDVLYPRVMIRATGDKQGSNSTTTSSISINFDQAEVQSRAEMKDRQQLDREVVARIPVQLFGGRLDSKVHLR
jgi:hypothetical protein